MKIINIFFPYSDFLYLLQLEEYDTARYLKNLNRFFFRRNFQKRGKLVLTSRAKTTYLLSIAITVIFLVFFNILTFLLIPIWVAVANLALSPIYDYIKQSIQKRAANYFSKNFRGKVVAIAGSYGKTTTKNYIYELVRYNYKTQMIPGNINTPTGIANWLLNNLKKNTEILIVEMDTYFVGEIKRSCKITPPDIAILTNVGDQHLERLGTKANLKQALNEVFAYAKKDAIKIENMSSNLEVALEVSRLLSIPKDIVQDTVKKLQKPDRRGNIKKMHGFVVIDQSYNISFNTAIQSLKEALTRAKLSKRSLVVITGGVPELGKENKTANTAYGKVLSKSGAEVILLQTIFQGDVLRGLKHKPFLANGMTEAWEYVQQKYDPKKVVILMQPELSDQYY